MLPLKFYLFSEQGDQTPIKMDGPGDPASKTASRVLTEMIQHHRTLQSRSNDYPDFHKVPSKIISTPR